MYNTSCEDRASRSQVGEENGERRAGGEEQACASQVSESDDNDDDARSACDEENVCGSKAIESKQNCVRRLCVEELEDSWVLLRLEEVACAT